MADKYAPEAKRSLTNWGISHRADPTERYATEDDPGRADLVCSIRGQCVHIEVKSAGLSFGFADWRGNQKHWALFSEKVLETPYWLFLAMGEHPPNYNPAKYQPRRTWLVPRLRLLAVERLLKPYQGSLPYIAGKGYDLTLQSRKWDAVHLLAEYELKWGKGVFGLPLTHPFYKTYQPTMIDLVEAWNNLADQMKLKRSA